MNWSEKFLKEKLPHDGLGFLNAVTIEKLKTYGEMCGLEGQMYQLAMAKGREIDKLQEDILEIEWKRLGAKLEKIATDNGLKKDKH